MCLLVALFWLLSFVLICYVRWCCCFVFGLFWFELKCVLDCLVCCGIVWCVLLACGVTCMSVWLISCLVCGVSLL